MTMRYPYVLIKRLILLWLTYIPLCCCKCGIGDCSYVDIVYIVEGSNYTNRNSMDHFEQVKEFILQTSSMFKDTFGKSTQISVHQRFTIEQQDAYTSAKSMPTTKSLSNTPAALGECNNYRCFRQAVLNMNTLYIEDVFPQSTTLMYLGLKFADRIFMRSPHAALKHVVYISDAHFDDLPDRSEEIVNFLRRQRMQVTIVAIRDYDVKSLLAVAGADQVLTANNHRHLTSAPFLTTMKGRLTSNLAHNCCRSLRSYPVADTVEQPSPTKATASDKLTLKDNWKVKRFDNLNPTNSGHQCPPRDKLPNHSMNTIANRKLKFSTKILSGTVCSFIALFVSVYCWAKTNENASRFSYTPEISGNAMPEVENQTSVSSMLPARSDMSDQDLFTSSKSSDQDFQIESVGLKQSINEACFAMKKTSQILHKTTSYGKHAAGDPPHRHVFRSADSKHQLQHNIATTQNIASTHKTSSTVFPHFACLQTPTFMFSPPRYPPRKSIHKSSSIPKLSPLLCNADPCATSMRSPTKSDSSLDEVGKGNQNTQNLSISSTGKSPGIAQPTFNNVPMESINTVFNYRTSPSKHSVKDQHQVRAMEPNPPKDEQTVVSNNLQASNKGSAPESLRLDSEQHTPSYGLDSAPITPEQLNSGEREQPATNNRASKSSLRSEVSLYLLNYSNSSTSTSLSQTLSTSSSFASSETDTVSSRTNST